MPPGMAGIPMPGMPPGMPLGLPPGMPMPMPHGMPPGMPPGMYPGMMYPGYPPAPIVQEKEEGLKGGKREKRKKQRKSSSHSSSGKKRSSSAGRRKRKKRAAPSARSSSDSSARRAAAAAALAVASGKGSKWRSTSQKKKKKETEKEKENEKEKEKEKEKERPTSEQRSTSQRKKKKEKEKERPTSEQRSVSRNGKRGRRRSQSRDRRRRARSGSHSQQRSRSGGQRRERETDKAKVYDSRRDAPPFGGFAGAATAAAAAAAAAQESGGWTADSRARGFQRPEKVEILKLPKSIIGKVIGKAGATIKDIRDRSGASLDARDQTEDPVHMLISGSAKAVADAQEMVMSIVEGSGARGNSPGSPSNDPAHSSSAPATRGFSDGPPPGRGGSSRFSDGPSDGAAGTATASVTASGGSPLPVLAGLGAGPSIEVHLELPVGSAGKIIGTKGQQIAEVRAQSGAQVDLDKSASMCKVRLVGTQQQVELARELITKIMAPPTNEGEFMEIPRSAVGRLIGAGGARIQELQERSGAKINIDRTTERCLVRFSGPPERIAAARALVADVLEGRDRAAVGEASRIIEVPPSCTGRLIGPGGKQINDIQEKSGAKVDIDKATEPHTVHIVGAIDNVVRAEAMIRETLQNIQPPPPSTPPPPQLALQAVQPPPPSTVPPLAALQDAPCRPAAAAAPCAGQVQGQMDEETIRLDVPKSLADKVFMDGGAWVRSVEKQTGARVVKHSVEGGACYLEMSGQPEQVVEAEQLCDSFLKSQAASQQQPLLRQPLPQQPPVQIPRPQVQAPPLLDSAMACPCGASTALPSLSGLIPPPAGPCPQPCNAVSSSFLVSRPRGLTPGLPPSAAVPPVPLPVPPVAPLLDFPCGSGMQTIRPPPPVGGLHGGYGAPPLPAVGVSGVAGHPGGLSGGCWPGNADAHPSNAQPPSWAAAPADWRGGQGQNWGAQPTPGLQAAPWRR